MVVVFPAPLRPRNPTTSPFSKRNEIPSTAVKAPKRRVRSETVIIAGGEGSRGKEGAQPRTVDP